MYSKAKYIVGEIITHDILGTTFGALVFSEAVPHSAFSKCFMENSIAGAGFFHIEGDEIKVYGDSVSLGVKSRPEDRKFIERAVANKNAFQY